MFKFSGIPMRVLNLRLLEKGNLANKLNETLSNVLNLKEEHK